MEMDRKFSDSKQKESSARKLSTVKMSALVEDFLHSFGESIFDGHVMDSVI